MKNENFRHTVLFWLKEPNNQLHRNVFESSLKKFIENSEFVRNKHLGIPADTNRQVIDSTFTYCLALSFLNKNDQDNYQKEPAHKLFLEESEALWEKVLVYDSENIL